MFRHVDNDPDNFSVGAHGNPKGVVDQLGRTLTPEETLAKMNRAGYNGQQPIKLYACETGKGGSESPAQKLANLSGQPVTAPTDLFRIRSNGTHVIDNGGTWVTFYPQPRGG